jgi:hypothetical protein
MQIAQDRLKWKIGDPAVDSEQLKFIEFCFLNTSVQLRHVDLLTFHTKE